MKLVILLVSLLAAPLSAQSLELYFLDVGQGDAVLIREGGKTALIDAGPDGRVLAFLRALGVDTLDLVVASHNHADHIGGMTGVLAGTVVRYYLDNGIPHTTATYQRTIHAVRASGAQYLQATRRSITLGSARLRILTPSPSRDHNNSSVGVLVEYGTFRALLTGDSEIGELEHWLRADSVPRVQVLKVAHHGAGNGTSLAWAHATQPWVAVISVGQPNRYGHPSASVVAAWEGVGARVYRTDTHGTLLVYADRGGSFSIRTAALTPRAAACRDCDVKR
jgi:beta-lactamase superfamily II metal-dependent hydrolase